MRSGDITSATSAHVSPPQPPASLLKISRLCGTVLRSAFALDKPYDRTKFPRPQSLTVTRAHHSTCERTARGFTLASIARNWAWRSRRAQSDL